MHSGYVGSLLFAVIVLTGCSSSPVGPSPSRIAGLQVKMGDGTVSSYAEFASEGVPSAIGVVWSANALESLPAGSDQHRCFGRN